MQNVELIGPIELGLRFIKSDDAPKRIRGVDHAAVFVFHADVEPGVIGKAIGEQRICARVTRSGAPFGNTNRFLPDRAGVGHVENFCLRVEELVQVREINVSSHPVGPDIVNGKKRSEIDFLRDGLSGRHTERSFRFARGDGTNGLAFASRDLKAEPWLPLAVAKIDISSRQIGDGEFCYDRFVGDVLQAGQFEFDLDLRARGDGENDDANGDDRPSGVVK